MNIKEIYKKRLGRIERNSEPLVNKTGEQISKMDENVSPAFITGSPFEFIMDGLDLIKKLFSLFEDDTENEQLDKIAGWMATISTQLGRFHMLLEDIRKSLVELKIHIDVSFQKNAENDLIATCQTFVDNVETYKDNLYQESTQDEIRTLKITHEVNARKLIRYGYAPAMTIAYAYMIEVDLIIFTKDDPEMSRDISKISERYAEYFDMCLDLNMTGSFVQRQEEAQRYVQLLTGKYIPIGREMLRRPPIYFYDNRGIKHRYHPAFKIEGDLKTGFTGSTYNIGEIYADDRAPDYATCRNFAEAEAIANQFLADTLLAEYNTASRDYIRTSKEKELLDALINCLKKIQKVVHSNISRV